MSSRLRCIPRFLVELPLILISTVVLVIAGLYLAGMFGGFDFTDEGSYYLSFVHPENVSDNQTSYFIFGGKLFALLDHNVVALRFCTLVVTLGGTLIFLRGGRRFLERFAPELLPDRERRWMVATIAVVGSFLGYAISPPALSYNFQNAFCLLAASGLLLGACAQPGTDGMVDRATLFALAGFGALVGLDFFVKFSSSVPLAVGGGLLFLIVSPKGPGQKVALGALLLLCLAAVALAYFVFFQGFTHWWAGIVSTAYALSQGSYPLGVVRRYGTEIIGLGSTIRHDFAPVGVVAVPLVLIVAALRAAPKWQARVAALAGLGLLGQLIWLVAELGYASAIGQAGLPFFLGCLILLVVLATASRLAVRTTGADVAPGRWRVWLAGTYLFALPYVGSFGTSNNINTNCAYQLAPWFVLAALLLAEIDHVWRTAWPSRLGLVLLAFVTAGQFYNGYWLQPYRVAGGARPNQNVTTPIGVPATNLRLSPETHDFIVNTRSALVEHGFKPGDDLLVLFDLPGFVFAMGGVSPGYPWYFAGDRNSLALDRMRLEFIAPARRKRAFIVRNALDQDWNDFLPDLRAVGLNFPTDYQLITPPMKSPFTQVPFEIWAPVAPK